MLGRLNQPTFIPRLTDFESQAVSFCVRCAQASRAPNQIRVQFAFSIANQIEKAPWKRTATGNRAYAACSAIRSRSPSRTARSEQG